MKRKNKKNLFGAIGMLIAFLLWSAAIQAVDVQAIGPNESSVGFATVNQLLRQQIGVHMLLYRITDWLSLVPLGFTAGFGILGSIQWMRRKSLRSVDIDILVLGAFYVAVLICYCFFEIFVINFRPVLMDGVLEPSYPSSTTVLVTCVMSTAMMQIRSRVKNCVLRRCIVGIVGAFSVFMVLGRLFSGVHWFTDIIGGVLLSWGLVMSYRYTVESLSLSGQTLE